MHATAGQARRGDPCGRPCWTRLRYLPAPPPPPRSPPTPHCRSQRRRRPTPAFVLCPLWIARAVGIDRPVARVRLDVLSDAGFVGLVANDVVEVPALPQTHRHRRPTTAVGAGAICTRGDRFERTDHPTKRRRTRHPAGRNQTVQMVRHDDEWLDLNAGVPICKGPPLPDDHLAGGTWPNVILNDLA